MTRRSVSVKAAEAAVVLHAMRLYNARRAGLKWPAGGLDCVGFYWTVRKNRNTQAFRGACARLAALRSRKGKR